MRFDLKRSLFLSLAALGFIAAAGTVNAQNASAKTYARVTSNQRLAMAPTARNVNFTGTSALYTKAGTLRGARVVASKAKLMSLANSGVSTNNVRAYQVATTNRGSIYYKVVTYNGQYRGWIYGGKDDSDFGGGLTYFTTFKTGDLNATLTAAQRSGSFKITNPGTVNNGQTVTYKQPAWTQYKVGRAITDSTPYANTLFKIDQVGTRTRENDQWVHIYDPNNANSPAAGWILTSGLTQVQTTPQVADNAIQINLVDPADNSKVIKSITVTRDGGKKGANFGYNDNGNWTISMSDRTSITNQIKDALKGTNYTLDTLTTGQMSQIAQTKLGDSVNISVNAATNIADNALRINFRKPDGTSLKTIDFVKGGANKGSYVGSAVSGSANWTVSDADKQTIQGQVNTALANSGYQLLGGNTLSDSQIDAIARGQYGSQVSLNVVPVSANYSTITPYGYAEGDTSTKKALTGISGDTLTAPVTVKDSTGKVLINNVNANDITADVVKAAIKESTDDDATVTKAVNEAIIEVATTQYQLGDKDFNSFKGTAGASFTEKQAFDYVDGDKDLQTLLSPKFSMFQENGDLVPMPATIQFTVKSADSGHFGTPVNVYYSYKVS
ncbi:S-layer family protein [Lentilactobacillus parakefiri]|uniref:S-layer family protein n=1 Tax=Lentilactobacillus parakefiri TaxID=152332 RepID=UPI000BA6E457|nr:S-layer family protein [Lentilactobacillus parakefiri]PAL01519.1 S-layer family protein [Lentilactobacillus parakefiri]